MRYLSVCSGIEAASVAWHPLGWTPVAFSEIEPFPSAVLAHHYPNVPNYGDMTKFEEWPIEPRTVDLLVGGTPCQSFSVAGLRKGISDPRGGLMLTYLEIARRFRPRWVVWENVPGVLSSGGGRDFGSLLGGLEELGYGWAYRVLDAQWVRTQRHPRAVPQRRRRVFVVGCLGDPSRAAEVLFECQSVQRDSSPRGAARKGTTADAEAGVGAGLHETVGALCADTHPGAYSGQDAYTGRLIPQPVSYDLFQITAPVNRQNRKPGDPCHTLARDHAAHAAVVNMQGSKSNACVSTDGTSFTLNAMHGHDVHAVAFAQNQVGEVRTGDVSGTLNTNSNASGRNTPMAAVAFTPGNLSRGAGPPPNAEVAPTQRCSAGRGADDQRTCVAFSSNMSEPDFQTDGSTPTVKVGSGLGIPAPPAVAHAVAPTITAANDPSRSPQSSEVTQQVAAVHAASMTVRRLTPRECERLQGFLDDWTLIPWRGKSADECPDGPRYKALGNSMAVNCMAWIGERIAAVDSRHDI